MMSKLQLDLIQKEPTTELEVSKHNFKQVAENIPKQIRYQERMNPLC